jgi:hypothetical protein
MAFIGGSRSVITTGHARGHLPVVPPPTFTLGTTQPNSSNTGYVAWPGYTGSLTNDTSPASPKYIKTISVDNTVVEGLRINGRVNITANNCIIRGCQIVGHLNMAYDTTSDYGLISSSGTGNLIEFCEITLWNDFTSTDNSAGGNGTLDTYWPVGVLMTGGSCKVNRCNIHDVNDCTYATAGTHTVQGNYLHDLMFRNDDQDQSGNAAHPYWSHNDGFQVAGGTGHQIVGNNFVMKFSSLTGMNQSGVGAGFGPQGTGNPNPNPNAEQQWPNCHGILFQNQKNALSGITVQNNWFKYGTNAALFTNVSGDTLPGAGPVCTGNQFTPDQGVQFSQYVQINLATTTAWSPQPSVDNTNIYSFDTDTPLAVQGQPLNGNPVGNPQTVGGTQVTWAYNKTTHTGNIPLSLTSP